MQNQLFNPEATITLPQSRLLAGLDPHFILVAPSPPLVQCTIGNDTQSNFQGLHINIFQAIAEELGWTQGSDYLFSCLAKEDVYNRVKLNDNVTCAAGDYVISSSLIQAGYKISQPFEGTGLNMLIRQKESRTIWSFLLPISLEVGLGLIGATSFVSLFVWFFEQKEWRKYSAKEHFTNFGEVIHDVFSSIYQTNFIELKRFPSRVLQWTFWLVLVVFLAIYQADLTDKLSPSYVIKEFRSFSDAAAAAKKISTARIYQPLIKRSIAAKYSMIYYEGDNIQDVVQNMITDLKGKVIDAIILPSDLTEYYDAQHCDVQILNDLISEFDYGLIFPATGDKDTFGNITQAIVKLTETHRMNLLKNQYMTTIPSADCEVQESISIRELAGLWIILGGAIVFSVIIHLLKKYKVIVPLKDYKPPYFTYHSQKTEIFENQLKEAVQFEIKSKFCFWGVIVLKMNRNIDDI